MVQCVKRYNIDMFESIRKNGYNYVIDPIVKETIQTLSKEVGDPKYVRTPHFQQRELHNNKSGSKNYNKKRETFIQFNTTKMTKKEGVEKTIDEIRKHLNKISEKNYVQQCGYIIDKLKEVIDSGIVDVDGENCVKSKDINDEFDKVSLEIFSIASGNLFYSEMYARLYKDLMDEFPNMKTIFYNNLVLFREIFKTIEYCNANEDYDKYCAINKNNDKRRATGMFYVNLMKLGVVPRDEIASITKELQNYQMSKISEPENKHIVDELSEVIYIMVVNSVSCFQNESVMNEWNSIIERVTSYSQMKVADHPSITSKSIFKNMDILDEINKKNIAFCNKVNHFG